MGTITILNEKKLLDRSLVIREAEISNGKKTFRRLGVDREDAVAVLILNTDSNKVILTKQFRYPITFKTAETIFEIVAGKVDKDENPFDTAIRETEEETGYRLKKENVRFLLSCFSTPGYSGERFFIYYATVTDADKISEGGGKEDENEDIEIIEMDRDEFDKLIRTEAIHDAKTYIAGLYLLLHNIGTT
jgi:ADP-ribose pyrophosphatase